MSSMIVLNGMKIFIINCKFILYINGNFLVLDSKHFEGYLDMYFDSWLFDSDIKII